MVGSAGWIFNECSCALKLSASYFLPQRHPKINQNSIKELVSRGVLRADQISRLLVPLLLEKSDKLARGKTKRTGTSDLDELGLQDMGFMWSDMSHLAIGLFIC